MVQGVEGDCRIWTGPTSGNGRGGGYGRISVAGVTVAVHRVSFTHYFGYVPSRRHIDHKCRNRLCWNPGHLQLVTHKKNCRLRDEAARKEHAS